VLAAQENESELGRSIAKNETLLEVKTIKNVGYSPREHRIKEEHVEELMEDLNLRGQLSPILVDSNTQGIVDGHHRLEAIKRLGWPKIRAIYQPMTEEECHSYALKNNILTETLTEIEEANKIKILIEKFGWSQKRLMETFRGKSKTWISFRMRLANLPQDIQKRIEDEESKITPSHGIWISELPTAKQQIQLADYVEQKELSVPETQQIVHDLKEKGFKYRSLEDELDERLQPSEKDTEIVSMVRDYAERESATAPLVKTGMINVSSLHILKVTTPSIKLRFSEHLCRSCGAKVNACPICKGKKELKNPDIAWLAPRRAVVEAIAKDQKFVKSLTKRAS